ncbi:hypothetical protein AALP_AAs61570U000100, partial [Arabis alpina]
MHECGGEKTKEVKRFKCIFSGKIEDEPRSPFVFFLEDFRGKYGGTLVEASRRCFNGWRNMTLEEQEPFRACTAEVDLEDDEADSKDVGKFDK